MKLEGRVSKLEALQTLTKQPCTAARELLQARIDKADPETRERLLTAIREQLERAA